MRQILTGVAAAVAVTVASAAPAMACGFGGCSPCGGAYVSPCVQPYVPAYTYPYAYSGCGHCGGWGYYERLADPTLQYHFAEPAPQYYYVNQGPTYTGPGAFAPYPYYHGAGVAGPAVYGYRWHHHYRSWHPSYHYGYHYGPYYHGRRVLRRDF